MHGLFLLLPLWLTMTISVCSSVQAADVFATDFSLPGMALKGLSEEAATRITGTLPEGWLDDSAWAKVAVAYTRLDEHGDGFQRVATTRCDSGRTQVKYPLPLTTEDTICRLSLRVRSPDKAALEVGIRILEPPYTYSWSAQTGELGTAWRTLTYEFVLPGSGPHLWFMITLPGVHTVDLQQATLTRVTKHDWLAAARAALPNPGQPNVLPITRWPLGLQSGWAINREFSDGDVVIVEADPGMTGPSGVPALKLQSDPAMAAGVNGIEVLTAPFAVPLPDGPHTASLAVYGDFSGTITALASMVELSHGDFISQKADGWHRVVLPFTPRWLTKTHALKIAGRGTLWIDALQVEAGAEATAYRPQWPCEIALACTGPLAGAKVQFDTQPDTVDYLISGVPRLGWKLALKVVNVYGDSHDLPAVALTESTMQRGTLAHYAVFPTRPLGAYRIEAQIVDGAGKPQSAAVEVIVNRLRQPRYWNQDAPNSPFGVHITSATRYTQMAKAIGANWVRLHGPGTDATGWYHVEPTPGAWHWKDADITRFRAQKLKILSLFSTAPRWASFLKDMGPTTNWDGYNHYFDMYWQPQDLAGWSTYCTTLAARYRGQIDAYEVWNEPWNGGFWIQNYDGANPDGYLRYAHGATPAADYARISRIAYEAAKAVDPAITIVGIGATADPTGDKQVPGSDWSSLMAKTDALQTCDAIGYHQYTEDYVGTEDDALAKGWATAFTAFTTANGTLPKPVWMTEGSPMFNTLSLHNGMYLHTRTWQEADPLMTLSDRLGRYLVGLVARGVKHEFLFSLHCYDHFKEGGDFRVLVNEDGSLHPTGAAHAAAAWFLEDQRFQKRLTVAHGIEAYLFNGPTRAVAVLLPAPGHAAWKIPTTTQLTAADLFANPLTSSSLGDTLVYLSATSGADLERALHAPAQP